MRFKISLQGLILVPDQTADGLYTAIVTFFNDNNIPYKENMVGFASDGASVMFRSKQGIAQKFRSDIPNIFITKCICHSLALCVSKACDALPLEVEKMMKDVYLYIRYSSKRLQEFSNIQVSLELPDKRLLNTCGTRWLALHACVDRFIEQYEAIVAFFTKQVQRNSNVEELLKKVGKNHSSCCTLNF